jgi:hypothetical protein
MSGGLMAKLEPWLVVLLATTAATGCASERGAPRAAADAGQRDSGEIFDGSAEGQPDAEIEAGLTGSDASDSVAHDASSDGDDGKGHDDASDPQPVSEYCGDAIRDPVLEECDDGADAVDVCDETCRVTSAGLRQPDAGVSADVAWELGTGSHAAAAARDGFALTYVTHDEATSVWLQSFDAAGSRNGEPLNVGEDTLPVAAADPVIAAIGDSEYVCAWTEHSAGTPDVVVRRVVAGRATSESVTVHDASAGVQHEPELLWSGEELLVAWSSNDDVMIRRFDRSLVPIDDEEDLAATATFEGNVVLAHFNDSWAAAWREGDAGVERVRVRAGGRAWVTQTFSPAPAGDRPALVQLDESHLLLVHTVGTDPLGTGSASVGRLRHMVLRTDAVGEVLTTPLTALTALYADDTTLTQRRPTAVRVEEEVFIAWEQESPLADERSDEVLLQRLTWDDAELVQHDERALPEDGSTVGSQGNPKLAASPLFPGGAVILAWENVMAESGAGLLGDVMFTLRPVPLVDLAPSTETD